MACRFLRTRSQDQPAEPDVNPTYGDYSDYSEPVVEVEDSDLYYEDVYMEGTSRVRDKNSNYGE